DCSYIRYVSTNGNDATGTGSLLQPWRTIKGAVAKFKAASITCGAIEVMNQLDDNGNPSVYDEAVGIVTYDPGDDDEHHLMIRGVIVSGKRPKIRPTTDGE